MSTIRSAKWLDSSNGLPLGIGTKGGSAPTDTPRYYVVDDLGVVTVAETTATHLTNGTYVNAAFPAVAGRVYTIEWDGDPLLNNNVAVGDRFKTTIVDGDEEVAAQAVISNLDAAVTGLPASIAAYLETAGPNPHGTGAWDATAAISQQDVRDAMKLAPTAGAPAAGSVDDHLDTIEADTAAIEPLVSLNLDATVSSRSSHSVNDIWTADLTGFVGLTTAGEQLNAVRQYCFNRLYSAPGNPGVLTLYLDDGSTPRGTYGLLDYTGAAVIGLAGIPARRDAFT